MADLLVEVNTFWELGGPKNESHSTNYLVTDRDASLLSKSATFQRVNVLNNGLDRYAKKMKFMENVSSITNTRSPPTIETRVNGIEN